MRISRPPQARRCRQKLREDVERALARFSGPALCVVLEGAIARFKATNVVAEVPASKFDATYAAYESYLAGRRKSEQMWTYAGWLQHAGLSEKFPAEEYAAIPAKTLPPTSVNLGNGTSELGPMQRKCLAGPDLHAEVACALLGPQGRRALNYHIQQAAHELEKAEAEPPYDVRLEVGYLLSAGRKLDAIKLIRERTPASLKAAIRYVDRVEEHWDMTPPRRREVRSRA